MQMRGTQKPYTPMLMNAWTKEDFCGTQRPLRKSWLLQTCIQCPTVLCFTLVQKITPNQWAFTFWMAPFLLEFLIFLVRKSMHTNQLVKTLSSIDGSSYSDEIGGINNDLMQQTSCLILDPNMGATIDWFRVNTLCPEAKGICKFKLGDWNAFISFKSAQFLQEFCSQRT